VDVEDYKSKAWELAREIRTEMIKAFTPILNEVGVTEHQASIIMAIKDGDFHTISKLAERLNANQGNFSNTCKKVEQSGLIIRKRSKEDERVVTIELTELGEQKVNELCKGLEKMFQKSQSTSAQMEMIIAGCTEALNLLHKINSQN
jgi:DNA-binding MarR family transcriptional regulator